VVCAVWAVEAATDNSGPKSEQPGSGLKHMLAGVPYLPFWPQKSSLTGSITKGWPCGFLPWVYWGYQVAGVWLQWDRALSFP
jgi:hypothetical protein